MLFTLEMDRHPLSCFSNIIMILCVALLLSSLLLLVRDKSECTVNCFPVFPEGAKIQSAIKADDFKEHKLMSRLHSMLNVSICC